MIKINLNGKTINTEEGKSVLEIAKANGVLKDFDVLAIVNDNTVALETIIDKDSEISLINYTDIKGHRAYVRTLQFVLIKAIHDIFPTARITIEHSLGKGIFGEIKKDVPLNDEDIIKIKKRMQELIDKDIIVNKYKVPKNRAIEIFKEYGYEDKIKLLEYIQKEELTLHEIDGRYDYFFGDLVSSTGILKTFDLKLYDPGFILIIPNDKDPSKVATFIEHKKLFKIFYETEQWGNILGVGDIASLNSKVGGKDTLDLILISEALHEKKIAYIADKVNEKQGVKLVLIAGPSSSGKTTFAKRLGIQLKVNGYEPVPISLDDYFVNRDATPLDENGEYDFESIDAIDIEGFNKDLAALMDGKTITPPKFNFITGTRYYDDTKLKVPENGILIVEGIHGLNEILTKSIPKESKFKIYISALTQINIDDHNRILTTDVRMLRRIVRDSLSRGTMAKETLKRWPSIKRGEEKNIFVFQEEADAMFNSTIIYEMGILKKYALKELVKIEKGEPEYDEARRLIKFLKPIKEVDVDLVPSNSIMREFIGGSCFYQY